MHLVYLDEVKYQPDAEPYQWLCGLAFPEDSIRDTERRVSEIVLDYFGSALLVKETELHAKEIIHGKGPYKGHDIARRVALLQSLIDVIDECPGLQRIEIRIDPSRMIATKHEEKAFMFLVEKVESLMKQINSIAMLISDHDKEMVSSNVRSLSSYKESGTDYQFGIDIEHIVDTIHHTHSHHSRLIQLADIYTYIMALRPKTELKYPKTKIVDYANAKSKFSGPSKYKHWPTAQSWYRKC